MGKSMAGVVRLTQSAVKRRNFLELLEYVDGQQAVTRCAECRWKYEGPVGTGKSLFEFHMQDVHGRTVRRRQ